MVLSFDEFLITIERYGPKRFRFIIRDLDPDDFDDLCLWVRNVGGCVFAIDELDLYMYQNNTAPPALEGLIRHGRHADVSLVAVGRRPADVPRLMTSQVDLLYTYRQVEPTDLKWLRHITGRKNVEELVASLPDYHVAVWRATDREHLRVARILLTDGTAELQYTDSGTPEGPDDGPRHVQSELPPDDA